MAVDEAGVESGESAILAQEYLAFELDTVEGVLDVFFEDVEILFLGVWKIPVFRRGHISEGLEKIFPAAEKGEGFEGLRRIVAFDLVDLEVGGWRVVVVDINEGKRREVSCGFWRTLKGEIDRLAVFCWHVETEPDLISGII